MQLSGNPLDFVYWDEAGAFRGWDVKYQSGYWQLDPGLSTSVVTSAIDEDPADPAAERAAIGQGRLRKKHDLFCS